MTEKQIMMMAYLQDQEANAKKCCEFLEADDREDDGKFEKIRGNIYGIFKAFLSAAEKTCGADDERAWTFILQRAEQIQMSWTASYEKAKCHGDVEKIQIESIKLDTYEKIMEQLRQIWEERA